MMCSDSTILKHPFPSCYFLTYGKRQLWQEKTMKLQLLSVMLHTHTPTHRTHMYTHLIMLWGKESWGWTEVFLPLLWRAGYWVEVRIWGVKPWHGAGALGRCRKKGDFGDVYKAIWGKFCSLSCCTAPFSISPRNFHKGCVILHPVWLELEAGGCVNMNLGVFSCIGVFMVGTEWECGRHKRAQVLEPSSFILTF